MEGGNYLNSFLLQLTQTGSSCIVKGQNPQKVTGWKCVDFLLIGMSQNVRQTALNAASWVPSADTSLQEI